jgi:hypothetical protein
MARGSGLLSSDLDIFEKLRIPPELLSEERIERVTDRKARSKYGITGSVSSDMSGIAFPTSAP